MKFVICYTILCICSHDIYFNIHNKQLNTHADKLVYYYKYVKVVAIDVLVYIMDICTFVVKMMSCCLKKCNFIST